MLLFAFSSARAANDEERDRALLRAAEGCVQHGAVVTGIRKGVVQIEFTAHGDAAVFERCYQEAAQRALEALAVGRLAENAVDTSAPIEITGSMIFVSALVNGSSARLLLDTGATKTIIRPDLAQRAGIEPGRAAPQATMVVVGGDSFPCRWSGHARSQSDRQRSMRLKSAFTKQRRTCPTWTASSESTIWATLR